MTEKTGYSTTTYRVRLYDKHRSWLEMTVEIYNQVQKFYYDILLEHQELWGLSSQPVMRQLELMTIGARGQEKKPEYPFPYGKVPLYYRRAAINAAIGVSRGYIQAYQAYQLEKEKEDQKYQKMQEGQNQQEEWKQQEKQQQKAKLTEEPVKAEAFHASPVFYAGMYRNLTADAVELKLWNGLKWVWVRYRYNNLRRPFPEGCEIKSPSLKLTKDAAWLHFPVTTTVTDVRTVKERIREKEDFCAVYFPNSDNLAVCAWMKRDGSIVEHHFIRGGNIRKEKRRQLIQKLKKNSPRLKEENETDKTAMPGSEYGETEFLKTELFRTGNNLNQTNQLEKVKAIKAGKVNNRAGSRIYNRIANLNQYYTHKVSREILDYCVENHMKLIVVPNYENAISFQNKRYLKTDEFDWLGRSIIRNLKYKSYQLGIVTATVRPTHIADTCCLCGGTIKRYNEGHKPSKKYLGGQLFVCENGHKGNAAQNSADNVGKNFLKYYQDKDC